MRTSPKLALRLKTPPRHTFTSRHVSVQAWRANQIELSRSTGCCRATTKVSAKCSSCSAHNPLKRWRLAFSSRSSCSGAASPTRGRRSSLPARRHRTRRTSSGGQRPPTSGGRGRAPTSRSASGAHGGSALQREGECIRQTARSPFERSTKRGLVTVFRLHVRSSGASR